MKTKILTLSIAVALPAALSFAEPPGGGPPRQPRGGEQGQGNGPQQGEQPRRPQMPPPMPFLHALDTDDDGIISAEEIKAAPEALKKLDKNSDGKLTPEEWHPPMPGGQGNGERPRGGQQNQQTRNTTNRQQGDGEHPQGPPPPPLLAALDTDHDGVISADEIAKSAESLATLDKNGDGQLGPREYGPKPPQGPPPAGQTEVPK